MIHMDRNVHFQLNWVDCSVYMWIALVYKHCKHSCVDLVNIVAEDDTDIVDNCLQAVHSLSVSAGVIK